MTQEISAVKAKEIELRRMEVERLHIYGSSIREIAEKMKVDERTIVRDIQFNRKERIKMLTDGKQSDPKDWLRNELADYIAFMELARKQFCEQSMNFKTEAAKQRALWSAVEIANQKIETIKSLIFSVDDLGDAYRLGENYDPYED